MPQQKPVVAIVGGSGMGGTFGRESLGENLEGLGLHVNSVLPCHPSAPFGVPGDLIHAECKEGSVLFVPRHGSRHVHPPSGLDWKRLVGGAKAMGATHWWATTACGSLHTDFPPGTVVLADQYIDFMGVGRSWFSQEPAVHLSMSDPTCSAQDYLLEQVSDGQIGSQRVGYLNIKGPRFSTRLESNAWKFLGAGVVGMTFAREAELVRGAQMHGSWLCLVTDWDAWRAGEEVSVEVVLESLRQMAGKAEQIFLNGIQRLFLGDPMEWKCGCRTALKPALQTPEEHLSTEHRRLLEFLGM